MLLIIFEKEGVGGARGGLDGGEEDGARDKLQTKAIVFDYLSVGGVRGRRRLLRMAARLGGPAAGERRK